MSESHRFRVSSEEEGLRLDQAIAKRASGVSRTLAKKILSEGGVFLDRKRVKVAGRIVREGQQVEVHIGTRVHESSQERAPVEIPIVALTSKYVVIEKPSGVFSAPTPESDRNDVLAFLSTALEERGEEPTLHLVHRLDRPTSGLMVLARTKKAAATLSEQLSKKSAQRRYEAIVAGPLACETTVKEPVGGKDAETVFFPRAEGGGATWVRAELKTGRTHQVRLHAEHLGAPIAGDSKYGRRAQRNLPTKPPRLALHASELEFEDPETGEHREFSSPMPQELVEWFESLGSVS